MPLGEGATTAGFEIVFKSNGFSPVWCRTALRRALRYGGHPSPAPFEQAKKIYGEQAVDGHRAFVIGIVDWFSRKLMAYNEVNTMDAFHCVETLRMAIERFGKPEIFNSDQGSQFTSDEFIKELQNNGIQISMDGRGRCRDNAKMERFWGR